MAATPQDAEPKRKARRKPSADPSGMTIRQALRRGFEELSENGIGRPDVESEWLMAATLGVSRARLWLEADDPLPEDKAGVFRTAVSRRAEGVPLAYLSGRQPFRYLELEVGPGVFIPRPETELLAEQAIEHLRARQEDVGEGGEDSGEGREDRGDGHMTVIDIGTGSGAIALAIAQEVDDVIVIAVDVSPEALQMAARNAERHGLEGRVFFSRSDLLANVDPGLLGRVDLIVSNPPYVPEEDMAGLPTEVGYEPSAALNGGPRGLVLYDRIAAQAGDYLRPGGKLMLELGLGQAEAVARILRVAGFDRVRILKDYADIDRIVTATYPGRQAPGR